MIIEVTVRLDVDENRWAQMYAVPADEVEVSARAAVQRAILAAGPRQGSAVRSAELLPRRTVAVAGDDGVYRER
jgi:hypothetical protein